MALVPQQTFPISGWIRVSVQSGFRGALRRQEEDTTNRIVGCIQDRLLSRHDASWDVARFGYAPQHRLEPVSDVYALKNSAYNN